MTDQIDKVYEFNIIPRRRKFYNNDSMWGCYLVEVLENDIPETIPTSAFDFKTMETATINTTTITGKMQELNIGGEYKVKAKQTFSPKWGYCYDVISIDTKLPKTYEEQKQFLQSIATENQAKTLLDIYPNIVEEVANGTECVDLSLTKGIKEYTWESIRNKILENYSISDILSLLRPLGVSFNKIKKLLDNEPNPTILKQKLLDNPYVLADIPKISFKQADAIALKLNPNFAKSTQRTSAFLKSYLTAVGEDEGHTWLTFDELNTAVKENILDCFDLYKQIIEGQRTLSTFLYIEGDKVGLKYYHDVEQEILDIIYSHNSEEPLPISEQDIQAGISDAESQQGFSFLPEQVEVLVRATKNNFTIITGKAGCVDCDTEFFNGYEWKKISKYQRDENVLQYNENGVAELVKPIKYIKQKEDYLLHFSTKGLDQCLSSNHNVYYITSKGNLNHHTMGEIAETHNSTNGFQGRFITSFKYSGTGIPYDEFTIRLFVASIADGTFYYHRNNESRESFYTCRFHLKKDRKKERIEWLINNSGYKHWKHESAAAGYTDFYVVLPKRIKTFDSEWYNCTNEQLNIICEELLKWNGCTNNNRMSVFTSIKENADFIQFAYSSCGFRASIGVYDRTGEEYLTCNKTYTRKSIEYVIHISTQNLIGLNACGTRKDHQKTEIEQYKTKDGFEYCFTVPSGMLVLRRNNKIFVTGNCGKTTLARGLLSIYSSNYNIGACALSAKAAKRIKEATGFEAMTIHRLLGATGINEFLYNENNPMPYDVVFVDEASMIYSGLFYHLLKAIKQGAKIILCGDSQQLPPIGWGNTFADFLSKSDLEICYLTKIMRQAEDSGIITDANKIRDGINPLDKPSLKIVHGVNQDMYYMFRDDRADLNKIAIKWFMSAVEKDGLENVFILTPRKDNCINSTKEINKQIQNLLIPAKSVPSIQYGEMEYRVGARVIHTKNDYEKGIFNGYIGTIMMIGNDEDGRPSVMVDYPDAGFITYLKEELDEINLAYALTSHRFQGSEADTIIAIVDNTHIMLLDSCFLYTTITRARKRCLLLAETYAFKKAINENNSINRQTWTKLMP